MNARSFISKALLTALLLESFCMILAVPAYAVDSGLDTPNGVASLPFSVQGVQTMTLTQTGLDIAPAAPSGPALQIGNGYEIITDRGDNCCAMFLEQDGGYATHFYTYQSSGDFQIHKYGTGSPNGPVLTISNAGNVGVGLTNPAYTFDVNGTAHALNNGSWGGYFQGTRGVVGDSIPGNDWSGCFGSDCTGGTATQYGVYGNGSSMGVYGNNDNGNGWGGYFTGANGVYGQTANSQGVYGYATGSGNGVLGESVSGWSGNFQGSSGVYGQSSGGWAGEFYTTASQNGVWIGNPSNNAQLCLNGQCVTSFPPTNVTWHGAGASGTNNWGYPVQLAGTCNARVGGGSFMSCTVSVNGAAIQQCAGLGGYFDTCSYNVTVPIGQSWDISTSGSVNLGIFLLY